MNYNLERREYFSVNENDSYLETEGRICFHWRFGGSSLPHTATTGGKPTPGSPLGLD